MAYQAGRCTDARYRLQKTGGYIRHTHSTGVGQVDQRVVFADLRSRDTAVDTATHVQ